MRLAPLVLEEVNISQSLSTQIGKQGSNRMAPIRFLHELDFRRIAAEPKPEQVPCLTIHEAKRKGFPHAYLIGVAKSLIPSWHAKKLREDGPGVQGERRNCFVAITPASESVTLTYARSFLGWDKRPSRYLDEMDLRALRHGIHVRHHGAKGHTTDG